MSAYGKNTVKQQAYPSLPTFSPTLDLQTPLFGSHDFWHTHGVAVIVFMVFVAYRLSIPARKARRVSSSYNQSAAPVTGESQQSATLCVDKSVTVSRTS